MESTELRRSTLERKDRDELVTIATALGSKPPSRARKSEIVDLIIKTATTETADDSGDKAATEAEGESIESTDAPESRPDKKQRASSSPAGDQPPPDEEAAEAEPVTYHAGDDEFDFGEVTTKGRSKKGSTNKERNAERGKGSGRKSNDRSDNDRNSGQRNGNNDRNTNDRNANDRNTNDRNTNDDDDDQSDRGNRRRRRRGRDGVEQAAEAEPVPVEGYLDLRDDGYGFLRVGSLRSSKEDAYVSVKQVRQFGLRKGDHLIGTSRPANRNEKNPALLAVDSINGENPDHAKDRPHFEDLTPLFPDEKLVQERKGYPEDMTARIIDLLAPIGKGQRGLIVSPPKAGKTTIMKNIAQCIERNNPEVQLIIVLLDERPEEVTDMRRSLNEAEVVASTFDRPAEEHIALAEITIERAKRMVESGRDVVLIVDGITRLARAYNQAAPANGRAMSGGLDSGAIYPPKKFFGAARNVEEGGSLTILATALVDTGSRMDEVIFEEFKGTGNMELRLDRRAAERRMYPAIDVDASSTRQEQLLFASKAEVDQIWKLRRVLSNMANESDKGGAAGLELLMDRLATFKTNTQFLKEVAKGV